MSDMSRYGLDAAQPAAVSDFHRPQQTAGGGVAATAPARAPHIDQPTNSRNALEPLGMVIEIAGSGSRIALDLGRLEECAADADPSVALAGQVGSQIKIRVGNTWLLASVRTQRSDETIPGGIVAAIDFLGEGDEEKLTGKIYHFRRGVTRSPIPGALI